MVYRSPEYSVPLRTVIIRTAVHVLIVFVFFHRDRDALLACVVTKGEVSKKLTIVRTSTSSSRQMHFLGSTSKFSRDYSDRVGFNQTSPSSSDIFILRGFVIVYHGFASSSNFPPTGVAPHDWPSSKQRALWGCAQGIHT